MEAIHDVCINTGENVNITRGTVLLERYLRKPDFTDLSAYLKFLNACKKGNNKVPEDFRWPGTPMYKKHNDWFTASVGVLEMAISEGVIPQERAVVLDEGLRYFYEGSFLERRTTRKNHITRMEELITYALHSSPDRINAPVWDPSIWQRMQLKEIGKVPPRTFSDCGVMVLNRKSIASS